MAAMEDEDSSLEKITLKSMQEALSNMLSRLELDNLTSHGLQILHFKKGFIRFNFVIPSRASDWEGNWHVGAIATIIDNIGVITAYTATNSPYVTMDYNISYYSSAKIQEEVEIEAKVIGNKGNLTSVEVEVRKKADQQQLIAIGKLWTAVPSKL